MLSGALISHRMKFCERAETELEFYAYHAVNSHVEAEDKASSEHARKGGIKGAAARAKSLSPERRSEIAKKAAAKRWKS
jgi:hypothetical protein